MSFAALIDKVCAEEADAIVAKYGNALTLEDRERLKKNARTIAELILSVAIVAHNLGEVEQMARQEAASADLVEALGRLREQVALLAGPKAMAAVASTPKAGSERTPFTAVRQ